MEAPVEVGQIVAGKYVVERVLARGGAGVVVKAKHVQLLEPCAIKLMQPRAGATPLSRERFLREARACARLKSDHVVRVFDVGELADGTPYMVLEYLEGLDLEERLARSKPIPVPEAVGYVLQVCSGLAEAHALGIVHRDLKPGNVFLSRLADGTTRVKILDFGISKDLFDAPGEQSRTEDGILVGSPLFMAPEQVRADEIDTRADLWAVGVILYYLVTGTFPFEGQKASDTMAHILTRTPAPPSQRVPWLPVELDRIILQCLEKDPALRPAGATELAAELAVLAEEGAPISLPVRRLLETEARVSIVGGRITLGPPATRRRWIWPAAFGGLALVAGAAAALALDRSPAPAGAPAASVALTASAAPTALPTLQPAAEVTAVPSVTVPAATASASASSKAPATAPATSASGHRRPAGVPSRGFDLGSRH
jgi:hypothetical protein